MKASKKFLGGAVTLSLALSLVGPINVFAATTPSVGVAATYGVLSTTYTNTVPGTTINGDVGFTTGPAVAPAGVHTNYGSGAPYSTAGTDQGSALTALAAQVCTFTFAPGAIDLATDTTHGPIGVYTPGVYCTTGAASIGTAGITLSGSGTYIFRIDGALNSVVNSVVTLAGASACDVFWTPTAATTLGANSTFVGTDIDASGITLGNNVTWLGRALAFGGTVTTDVDDTITAPTCVVPPVPPVPPVTATLIVIKNVINDNAGTSIASNFTLNVSGTNVSSSSFAGSTTGVSVTLDAGAYAVTEASASGYTSTSTATCSGVIAAGETRTCTFTNDDIAVIPTPVPPVPPVVPPVSPVVPPVVPPTPTLPITGFAPVDGGLSTMILASLGLLGVMYVIRKKLTA